MSGNISLILLSGILIVVALIVVALIAFARLGAGIATWLRNTRERASARFSAFWKYLMHPVDWSWEQINQPRPLEKIYKLLWVLGLMGAALAYLDLQGDDKLGLTRGGFGYSLVIVLALATSFQQFSVYNEFYRIEGQYLSEVQEQYPNWIDRPRERILRLFILLSLLLGVGKLLEAIEPLMQRVIKPLM